MATRMQQRKGTAAQWISTNGGDGPVLNAGEIGYEIDTNKFKIGDGISHWVDLNYFADVVELGGNIDDYIPLTQRGVANGVATLDGNGVIPSSQIPSLVGLDTEIASAVSTAVNNLVDSAPGALNTLNELAASIGDDANYASTVTNALALKAPVNNPTFTGTVAGITKSMVGLENVNNSSDADKPISTATQTVLDLKAPIDNPTFTGTVSGVTKAHVGLSNVDNTSDENKPVSSAVLTALGLKQDADQTAADAVTAVKNKLADGTGIDITQDPATKVITIAVDGTIATEDYVDTAIGAFDALPTQTGNNGKFLQTTGSTTQWATVDLSSKQDKVTNVSDTEIGFLDGVTSAIQTQLDAKAPLASPTFTGTVTLPANTISQSMMSDDSVGTNEIGGLAVTEAKIADGAVTSAKIANDTIVNADINSAAAIAQSKISGLTTDLAAKAALSGANFTGNVEVDGNLVVDGDFTVNGTNFSASATSITIEDNLVQLAHQNAGNTVDLGIVVGYNDGAAKHSGIVRDVSADKWKLFKGVTTEPSTTVDFTQGSLDALQVAGFEATSATIGDVSNTELQYLNGVTSAIQTQLDGKEATLPSQSGNSGKYLTNNGSGTLSWATVSGYLAPTLGSTSIASGATVSTIAGLTLTGPIIVNTIISQTSSYTPVLGDASDFIEMNSSSGNTLTVPTNANVAYPVGTTLHIVQVGTGQTTVVGDTGVTVNGTPGLKLRTQWSAATLVKRATNTWVLFGDITA